MINRVFKHLALVIMLSCTSMVSMGQSTPQDYAEGWEIEFLDTDIATIGDDRVEVNKIVSNISAAGNNYNGGTFSCSVSNYGTYRFASFSLETADGAFYKMYNEPKTYAQSMTPEVLQDKDDSYFIKFSGRVKNGDDIVEIKGYFKNF